jgi:hypothetical protein
MEAVDVTNHLEAIDLMATIVRTTTAIDQTPTNPMVTAQAITLADPMVMGLNVVVPIAVMSMQPSATNRVPTWTTLATIANNRR